MDIKCPDCGGNYECDYYREKACPERCDKKCVCPTCKGRKLRLEVECENSDGNGCQFAEDGSCSCRGGYRPMTEADVEGLVAGWNCSTSHASVVSLAHIISYIQQGMNITYKGRKVRVKEEG